MKKIYLILKKVNILKSYKNYKIINLFAYIIFKVTNKMFLIGILSRIL